MDRRANRVSAIDGSQPRAERPAAAGETWGVNQRLHDDRGTRTNDVRTSSGRPRGRVAIRVAKRTPVSTGVKVPRLRPTAIEPALILLGVTVTGRAVLLPTELFGTERARGSLIVRDHTAPLPRCSWRRHRAPRRPAA